MMLTLLRRGTLVPVPPVEDALRFPKAEGAGAQASSPGRRAIAGSPETVRAGLETLARDYGADEVIAVTITHDHGARRRSYELLADAVALPRAARPLAA